MFFEDQYFLNYETKIQIKKFFLSLYLEVSFGNKDLNSVTNYII